MTKNQSQDVVYLRHFDLQENPFKLTPDTSYFFNSAAYQEAINVVLVALSSGEGFVKLTGEVGSGKTLLCRTLLNTLEKRFNVAYIPNPLITPMDLYKALADELGIEFDRDLGFQRFLNLVTQKLMALTSAGKNVALLVDEAQSLPDDTLEALRLMTNLETEKHKILQVALFAQPELDRRLEHPAARPLRQRITFSHRLGTIQPVELESYIGHRLRVAGHNGRPLFSAAALRKIDKATQGVPRLINILCHKSLMAAYGEGEKRVAARHIQKAVRDTDALATQKKEGRLVRVAWGVWSMALLSAVGVAVLIWKIAL